MINNNIKENIAIEVINTLYSRFLSFPNESTMSRNEPFLKAFLKAFEPKLCNKNNTDILFVINMASWLHGLKTTLGQSFFESIGSILSGGQKKSFSGANSRLNITNTQKEEISDIITDLKNRNRTPNLLEENNRLIESSKNGHKIDANDFTVDIFYENNDEITCIELKSVRPNAGELRGEKQKILEAKAALIYSYPGKKINYFFGFPFDPTSTTDCGYDKNNFRNSLIDGEKYLAIQEFLLASELWDFLSNETNTMECILEIINKISTPEFQDYFCNINNSINRDKDYATSFL